MIQKHQYKITTPKNLLKEDKKMFARSASSNFFKFIWLAEDHPNILKPLKSIKQQEQKPNRENKYSQQFFNFNNLPMDDIEDGALFDSSADEAKSPPYLKRFYEEIETKRKHTNALCIFRDKAHDKIKNYSKELSRGRKVSQYFKESFISQVGTYQEKYKKCSIVYNDFINELNGAIQTRYELLSLTCNLINELNYPTGWSCTTGFDLMDVSLKEAGLPKLTFEEKDSIKHGIIPCEKDDDEDDSFYPMII